MINRWFTATVALIIFILLFFPAASWRIQHIARYGFRENVENPDVLRAENMQLKSELANSQDSVRVSPKSLKEGIPAFVYSQYPMPFKNELMISVGEKQGVKVGDPVIFSIPGGGEFLIGKIAKAWSNYASVQTIFDKEFKMAVRVGKNGADSLLSGGVVPQLTLIPKAKPIEPGQIVYSASPDLPYGVAIGEVGVVTLIPETSMQEAELTVPYDPNAIHSVLVDKKDS